MIFRVLKADEIDIRVGQAFKTEHKEGATLLLYKNARVDMDILDETVGAENWQRSQQEIKGNLYCNVSIFDKDKGEWTTKQDCGVESNTEAEKGEASDAFKRACVNWGIGRELYKSPKIFIKWEVEQIEKNNKKQLVLKYNPSFVVKDIGYTNNRTISKLIIAAISGGKETIVFDWKAGEVKKDELKSTYTQAAGTQSGGKAQGQVNGQQKQKAAYNANNGVKSEYAEMTLKEALDYKVTFGKMANVRFEEIPEYYLEWLIENAKVPATRLAAELVLKDIRNHREAIGAGSKLEIIPLPQEQQDELPFD